MPRPSPCPRRAARARRTPATWRASPRGATACGSRRLVRGGDPARPETNQPTQREILREHRAARDPRRDPATVRLPGRQRRQRATAIAPRVAPAQPLPADVTVTAAELGGVPTAEITVDGIEPRHVVLYFHGGVYVM